MTPPERTVPVESIREAVARAAASTSLRAVARASDLSDRGLQHFLDGGTPRQGTLRKLTEWYVREAASAGGLDADTAHAALSLLLDGLPEPQRSDTRCVFLDAIHDAYRATGRQVPAWLK